MERQPKASTRAPPHDRTQTPSDRPDNRAEHSPMALATLLRVTELVGDDRHSPPGLSHRATDGLQALAPAMQPADARCQAAQTASPRPKVASPIWKMRRRPTRSRGGPGQHQEKLASTRCVRVDRHLTAGRTDRGVQVATNRRQPRTLTMEMSMTTTIMLAQQIVKCQ